MMSTGEVVNLNYSAKPTGGGAGTELYRLDTALPTGQYFVLFVENFCDNRYIMRIGEDATAPVAGLVSDGLAADLDAQVDQTSLSANWSGFSDPETGIGQYAWAIGSTPGGYDVRPFTSVGLATSATATGLSLAWDGTYYVTVRAYNGEGSPTGVTSDGITITNKSSRLALVSPAYQFTAGVCGGATKVVQVQLQTLVGAPLAATVPETIVLQSSSGAATWYTDAACATPAPGNAFTLPTGQTTLNAYYTDTLLGTPYLSTTNLGGHINAAPQQLNVIAGPAVEVALLSPPRVFVQGSCSGYQGRIELQYLDAYGNRANAPAGGVTLTPTSSSPGATWYSDSLCATPLAGGALFTSAWQPSLYYLDTTAGTPVFNVANDRGLAGPSAQQHTVLSSTPTQLFFFTPERTLAAGQCPGEAGKITVELRDTQGNPAAAGPGGVALTASSDSGTGAWYLDSGCTLVAIGGAYLIDAGLSSVDLYYADTRAGSPAISLSNAGGLPNPAPQVHTIVPGPASRLSFATPSRTFTAGQCAGAGSALSVQLEDAFGNPALAGFGGVAFTASSSSAGTVGWYSDSSCASPVAAGAYFIAEGSSSSDMHYTDTQAGAPSISLDSSLAVPPPQTQTVLAGPAAGFSYLQQPANVLAGQPLSPSVRVGPVDSFGNAASSGAPVSLTLVASTGATLGGTLTRTPGAGGAVFDDLWVDKAGEGYRLEASTAGYLPAQSAPFDVAPGAPAQLVLTAPLSTAVATHDLSPAPSVTVLDAHANLVTTPLSIVLEAATGPGLLSGATTQLTVSGVASFSSVRLDTPGSGYALRAASGSLLSANSSAFDVAPALSASPQTYVSASQAATTLGALGGQPPYSWTVITNASGGSLSGSAWTAGPAGHCEDVLRVTDQLGDTALAFVQVRNNPPTVSLQAPGKVVPGTAGVLRAVGQDADADVLGYSFLQLSGPAVVLNASGATATFFVPMDSAAGDVVFALDVTDGFGGSVRALTSVAVATPGVTPQVISTPASSAVVGAAYSYDLDGLPSALGDGPLLWSGSISPPQAGFSVSSVSGRIFWLPQSEGSFVLSLFVQGPAGSDRQDFTVQATGGEPPLIARTANPNASVRVQYLFDADGRLQAAGTPPIVWTLEAGPEGLFVDPATGLITWLPPSPGVHEVRVRADNREGSDTYAFSVTVESSPSSPPAVSAQAEPSMGPVPLAVQFDAAGSVGTGSSKIVSYRWDFGDGTPPIFAVTPPPHSYLKAGGYLARLEVVDAFGAISNRAVSIKAMDREVTPPTAKIVASNVRASDGSLTVALTCDCKEGSAGFDSFLWDYGDGDGSTQKAPVHTFSPAGRYQVRLLVTDQNGLTSADSVEVAVTSADNIPPFARLSVAPPEGPVPLLVHFSAEYGDPDGIAQKVSLSIDGQQASLSQALAATLSSVGEHEACLEVLDADGLSARDCVTVDVQTADGVSTPKVVSLPALRAQVGVPYQYDEDGAASAIGSRPHAWAVGMNVGGTLVGAPDGMSVESSTGRVHWTPSTTGRHSVVLRAGNSAGTSVQSFEVQVSGPSEGLAPVESKKPGCGCSAPGGALALWGLWLTALTALRRRKGRQ